MISTRDLEWAAGFIEGEGGFQGTHIGASVAQTDMWSLLRLQRLFGGAISPKIRYNPRHKKSWTWHVSGERAAGVVMTMYSLLSPRRQQQIRPMLDAWRRQSLHPRYRKKCVRGHEYNGLYTAPDGETQRTCTQCRRIHSRNAYARQRELRIKSATGVV